MKSPISQVQPPKRRKKEYTKPMSTYIAIIEDDPFISELAVVNLEQAGYTVAVFTDAESALLAFETQQPDFMLVDEDLPSMKGSILLAQPQLSDVPGILYTNSSEVPAGFVVSPQRQYLFKAATNGDDLLEAVQKMLV